MRKILNHILLITPVLFGYQMPGQSDSLIMKSTFQAEYSVRRTAEMSRTDALKSYASRVEKFNEQGQLIEYRIFELDGSVYRIGKINRSKDNKEQLTMISDGKEKHINSVKSHFNQSGNLTISEQYNLEGDTISIQSNVYDSTGNLTLQVIRDIERNWIHRTEMKYNSLGQLIERSKYNPAKSTTNKRTYIYNEQGQVAEEELTRQNGDYIKFISEYDELGNLIEQYWYNDQSELIDQTSFKYIYDEQGNWITKKRLSGGKLNYVWEREIEYW